jgi:hypothetical protein
MTQRELRTIGLLIEWAVAPAPPLPPVAATDAVAAFARDIECSPASQRLALRGLLALASRVPPRRFEAGGPLAGLGDLFGALAHLAYYGDAGVMRVIGYDPVAVRERGRAIRIAEARP